MISTNRLQIHEIFNLVDSSASKEDKIKILRKHASMPLFDVCRGFFDPKIQWNLPAGEPPYTPYEEGPPPSSLLKQHLKFKYFVSGLQESERLDKVRREKMFLNILESVDPGDATLLASMINKPETVKGLSVEIIKEAFPDLIQD
jgi:hypothetical protein